MRLNLRSADLGAFLLFFSFEEKSREMRRKCNDNCGCGQMVLAAGALALFVACGISEIADKRAEAAADGYDEGLGSPFRPVCCVTGMSFPSGYDWSAEDASEPVNSSLIVFADGVPKMEIPVGDGYEVSRDPDMHRVVDGSLYTFYSKGGVCVMKRNGAPLFRYDGDEVLMDIRVRGEDVFTLNHKRSGGGHSLRKNGEVVIERMGGETYGRFWEDGKSLCYAFRQPVAVPQGLQERYYVVSDSEMVPLAYGQDICSVWDLMSSGGVPCSLVSSTSDGRVSLLRSGDRKRIDIPDSATVLSCRLFPADSLIGVECLYRYHDGRVESGIWIEGGEYMRFETGNTISYICYSEGKVYCVLNPEDGDGVIFDSGKVISMPEGYSCTGHRPLAVGKDALYVALSSKNGKNPVIWHDGQLDTLNMNGYICSVSFTGVQEPDTPR